MSQSRPNSFPPLKLWQIHVARRVEAARETFPMKIQSPCDYAMSGKLVRTSRVVWTLEVAPVCI
jgi:hypothetical protein